MQLDHKIFDFTEPRLNILREKIFFRRFDINFKDIDTLTIEFFQKIFYSPSAEARLFSGTAFPDLSRPLPSVFIFSFYNHQTGLTRPNTGAHKGNPLAVGKKIFLTKREIFGIRFHDKDTGIGILVKKPKSGITDIRAAIHDELWIPDMRYGKVLPLNKNLVKDQFVTCPKSSEKGIAKTL